MSFKLYYSDALATLRMHRLAANATRPNITPHSSDRIKGVFLLLPALVALMAFISSPANAQQSCYEMKWQGDGKTTSSTQSTYCFQGDGFTWRSKDSLRTLIRTCQFRGGMQMTGDGASFRTTGGLGTCQWAAGFTGPGQTNVHSLTCRLSEPRSISCTTSTGVSISAVLVSGPGLAAGGQSGDSGSREGVDDRPDQARGAGSNSANSGRSLSRQQSTGTGSKTDRDYVECVKPIYKNTYLYLKNICGFPISMRIKEDGVDGKPYWLGADEEEPMARLTNRYQVAACRQAYQPVNPSTGFNWEGGDFECRK